MDVEFKSERVVIFVNDDVEYDRQVTEKLEKLGYTVHLARTADDALGILRELPRVDLLLFNIEIQEGRCMDDLMRIKNMHPTLPVVPSCPIRHQDHQRREAHRP